MGSRGGLHGRLTGRIQLVQQDLIMLLMNLSDPVEQLANFGILAFLGVVVAFFHRQQFPGKLILQIVEILGGQLQPAHSFP